jgi:hypothetical protein
MYTAFISSFGVIQLIAFILKNRSLHILEILFVWMWSFFIYASATFLVGLNYSLIVVSQEMEGFLANEVFRLLIIPLSITWLMDLNALHPSWKRKVISTTGFVAYIYVFLYILEQLGFVTYKEPFNVEWSTSIYAGVIMAISILKSFFHKLFQHEVIRK